MYTLDNTSAKEIKGFFSKVAAQVFEDLSFQDGETLTIEEVGIGKVGKALVAYTCKLTDEEIEEGEACPTLMLTAEGGLQRSISGLKSHKVTIVKGGTSYPLKEEGMSLAFKKGVTIKVQKSLNEAATAASNAGLKRWADAEPGRTFRATSIYNVTITVQ